MMFRRGLAKLRGAVIRDAMPGDDESLAARILSLKARAKEGGDPSDVDTECLAVTAAAATRVTGADASDGDLAAGMLLCSGMAVDDKHVDNPALALALPTVLRAVYGETVHLISPTQQEAARRASWLRPVTELLGLRVDLLGSDDDHQHRAARYDADIVCGELAQFAFDVLRNTLSWKNDERVAATTEAAVIDRIDTVLIEQAYTTPQISAPATVDGGWHRWASEVARRLERDHHFVLQERIARLIPAGIAHVADQIDMTTVYRDHAPIFQLVEAAVTVRECYRSGRDYEISDGAVTDDQLPPGIREAIAVQEGLPVTTAPTTLALTSGRAHVLRYEFVTGLGTVTTAAARRLRRRYGLRAHARRWADPSRPNVLSEEFDIVVDDVRIAHDETLMAWREELTEGGDRIDVFWALVHEHVDELVRACRDGELTYPQLLETLGRAYPCSFAPHPPAKLSDGLLADVERALAERVEQVESMVGDGAMAELIRKVALAVVDKHRRRHLADLHTICIRSYLPPPGQRAEEFRRQADERFATLWRDLREDVIGLTFHVELDPEPPD